MSEKNIKVINVKDYSFGEEEKDDQEGGARTEELDDFLGDVGGDDGHSYKSNRQDIVEFFSDSEEHSQGGYSDGENDHQKVTVEKENEEEEDSFWGGKIEAIDEEMSEKEEEENTDAESVTSYGGKSAASTVDELSQDPMFLVLSHFLTSKTGENIADILQGIKLNLAKLSFKA